MSDSSKMDDAIDRTEKMMSTLSIGDVNMKLVLTTARLTDNVSALSSTVSSLNATVSTLATDVNGVQGVRSEMKDIRHDMRDTNKKVDGISSEISSAMVILWRVVWFLCIIGVISIISNIRALAPLIVEGFK